MLRRLRRNLPGGLWRVELRGLGTEKQHGEKEQHDDDRRTHFRFSAPSLRGRHPGLINVSAGSLKSGALDVIIGR